MICVVATATVHSGNCGDNVSYNLDTDTGVLTISGTGDTYDYAGTSNVP